MRLRAPVPADLEAVFGLIAARQSADLGEVEYTLENIDDEWRMSDFDLVRDARVVENDHGRIVAYGLVRLHGAVGMVAPDAEGGGAGTLLIAWLEDRERALNRSRCRQYVAGANRSAEALLRSRGYDRAWSSLRMARALGAGEAAPPAPPGIEIRGFEAVTDLHEVHSLDNRAFSLDPGYEPESLAFFEEEHVSARNSAPELSFVATEAGRIVGFVLSFHKGEEIGYVDVLATDPDHQRRGIGRALLLTAFAAYAAAGLTSAQLGVSSINPRALHLYESAGMTPRFRHDIYERPA